MNRTFLGILFTLSLMATARANSQNVTAAAPAPMASVALIHEPGDQDGPDHAVYKKGYDLILSEQWDGARKQFAELLQKYPKSDYADDAHYWTAYALMHTDLKKALANYQEFVKNYPKSTYYDDAVADIQNLQAQLEVIAAKAGARTPRPSIAPDAPNEPMAPRAYAFDSKMRHFDRSMRMMNRRLAIAFSPNGYGMNENKLDEKTRLKLDALTALGENTNDEKAFTTLKDVALDPKQPLILRKQALNQLSDFKTHDVDAIYLDLVKRDTSEEIQVLAIDNIGESSDNKDKTVQTLQQLFTSLPAKREDQRAAALYRIADVGNDQAVEFLSKVARTDSDYDLRSDAVYYLGNIGGDKARAVLYDILKGE